MVWYRPFTSGVFLSTLVTCVVASITLPSPKAQTLQTLTLLPSNYATTPTSFTKGAKNVTYSKVDNVTIVPANTKITTVLDNVVAVPKGNVTFSTPKTLTDSAVANAGVNITKNLPPSANDNTVTNNTVVLPWTKWSQKKAVATLRSALVFSSTAQPTSKSKLLRSSMNGKSMFHTSSAAKSFIPEDVEWEPMDDMERNGHVKNRTGDPSPSLPMVRDFIFRVKSSFANPTGPDRHDSSLKDTPKPANVAFVTKLRSPNRRPGILDATQRPMAAITFVSPNHTKSSASTTEQLFIGSSESSEVTTSILKLKHKPTSGSHLFIADDQGPMIPKPDMSNITNTAQTMFSSIQFSNKTNAHNFNQPHAPPTTRMPDNSFVSTKPSVYHQSTTSSLGVTERTHQSTEATTKSTVEANQTNSQQSKSKFKPSTERIWIPVAVSTPPPRTRPVSNSNQMIIKTPTRHRATSRPTLVRTSTPKGSNATKVSLKYKDSHDNGYFDKSDDPLSEALLSSDIMYANSEKYGDNSVYAHTTVHAPPGIHYTTPGYVTLAWSDDRGKLSTIKSTYGTTYSTSAHPILVSALVNGPDFSIYEDDMRGKPHVAPGHEYDGEYVHSEAPTSAQQAPVVFAEVSYDPSPYPGVNIPATHRPAYKPLHKPGYTTIISTHVDASYGITEKPSYDTTVYQTSKPNYGSNAYNTKEPPHSIYQTTKPNYGNPYSPAQMNDNYYQPMYPTNSNTYDSNKAPQYGAYETKKPNYITTKSPAYQPTQPTYGNSYNPTPPNSYGSTTIGYGNSRKPTTVKYGNGYETQKPPIASYQKGRPPSGDAYQSTTPTYDGAYQSRPPPPSPLPPNYNEYNKPQTSYVEYDKPQASQPYYTNNDGKNEPRPSYNGQNGAPNGQSPSYSENVPSQTQPNHSDYNKPEMTSTYQHKEQQMPSYYAQDEKSTSQSSSYAGASTYTTVRPTYYDTATTPNPYMSTPGQYERPAQSGPPPPYYTGEVPAPGLYPPIYYPSSPTTKRPYPPPPTYETKPQASYYDESNPSYSTTPYYKPQIQPSYYTDGNPNPSKPATYQGSGDTDYNSHPKPMAPSYEGGNYANTVTPSYTDGGMNPYPSDKYGGNGKPSYNNVASSQYPPNNYEVSGQTTYNEGGPSLLPTINYAQENKPSYSNGGSNPYAYGGYSDGSKPPYNGGGANHYPPGGYTEGGRPEYNDGDSIQNPSGSNGQSMRPPHSSNTLSVQGEGGVTTNFPFLVGDEETGLDAAGLAALATFLSTANSSELDFEDLSATTIQSTALHPGQASASSAATNLRPFSSGSASTLAAFLMALTTTTTTTTELPNDPEPQANDEPQGQGEASGGSNGTLQKLLLAIGISVIPTATIAVLVGLPSLLMGRRRRDISEGNNKERVAQLIDEVNASMEKYVSSLPDILTTEKGDELRQYCAQTLEQSTVHLGGRPGKWLKMRKSKKQDGLTWKKIFQHVRSFLPRLRFGLQSNETSSQRARDGEDSNKNESGIVYIPVNPDELSSTWYKPSTMKRPGNTIKNRLSTTLSPPSSSEEVVHQEEFPIARHFQELLCRKIMSFFEDDEDELDSELEDFDSDVIHDISKEVPDSENLPVSDTAGVTNSTTSSITNSIVQQVTNDTIPHVTHVASFTVPNIEAAAHLFQQGVISEMIKGSYLHNQSFINNSSAKITGKLTDTEHENNSSLDLDEIHAKKNQSSSLSVKDDQNGVTDKGVKDEVKEKGKTMSIEDINKVASKENILASEQEILPTKVDPNSQKTKSSTSKSRVPLAVIIVYDKDNYTVSYLDRKLMRKTHVNKAVNKKRQLSSKNDNSLGKASRYEEIALSTKQTADLNSSTTVASRFNDKATAAKETSVTTSKPTQKPNTTIFDNESEQQSSSSKSAVLKDQLPILDFKNNWKEFNHILTMLSQSSLHTSDENDSAQNSIEFAPRELNKSNGYITSTKPKISLSAENPDVQNLSWVARPRRDVNKLNSISNDIIEQESVSTLGVNHVPISLGKLLGLGYSRNNQSHPTNLSLKHRKKSNGTKKFNQFSRQNSTKSLKTANFKLLESQRSNSVSSLLPLPKIPDNIQEGKLYIYHLLMSPKTPSDDTETPTAVPLPLMHGTSTTQPTLADNNKSGIDLSISQNSSWLYTTTVHPRTSTTTESIITTVSSISDQLNNSSELLNAAKDIRSVNPPVRILTPSHLIPPVASVFRIPIQVENSTPEYMHILGSPIAWPLNPLASHPGFTPYIPTTTSPTVTSINPQIYSDWFHHGWGHWNHLTSQPLRPTEVKPYPNPIVPNNNIWYHTNSSQNNLNTRPTSIASGVPPHAPINTTSAAAAPTTINIYTIHGLNSDILPFIKNSATTPHKLGDDGYSTVTASYPAISQAYYDDDDYDDVEYNFQPSPVPVITKRPQPSPRPTRRPPNRRPTTRKPSRPRPTTSSDIFQDPPFFEATTKRIRPANIRPRPIPQVAGCVDCTTPGTPGQIPGQIPGQNTILIRPTKKPAQATKASFLDILNQKLGINAKGGLLPLIELGNLGFLGQILDPWANTQVWWDGDKRSMDANNTKGGRMGVPPLLTVSINNQPELKLNPPPKQKRRPRPNKWLQTNLRFRKMSRTASLPIRNDSSIEEDDLSAQDNSTVNDFREASPIKKRRYNKDSGMLSKRRRQWHQATRPIPYNGPSNSSVLQLGNIDGPAINNTTSVIREFNLGPMNIRKYKRRRLKPGRRFKQLGMDSNVTVQQAENASVPDKNIIHETKPTSMFNTTDNTELL